MGRKSIGVIRVHLIEQEDQHNGHRLCKQDEHDESKREKGRKEMSRWNTKICDVGVS